ncbi:MAG: hypothetical protein Q9168_004542 [Polycauliona sp. 1 TL-2023]
MAEKPICTEVDSNQRHDTRPLVNAQETPLDVPRLLRMPGEIQHLICHHMDVDSFFVALQTCKSLNSTAQSRLLLLRQIGRIPGLRLGLEDLDGLYEEFLIRARKHCLAAGVFADLTLYTMSHEIPSLAKAVVASSFVKCRLAVVDGVGNILVLQLCKRYIRLEFKLWPNDCDFNINNYDVARTAFTDDGHLAVLYRPRPGVYASNDNSQSDDAAPYDSAVKLIVFDLHQYPQGPFGSVQYALDVVQHSLDIPCCGHEDPISLSMLSCLQRPTDFLSRQLEPLQQIRPTLANAESSRDTSAMLQR